MDRNTINDDSISKTLLLIAGGFIFAYSFGVFVHEIGHVLAYKYYGIDTKVFVFDPLGRSYMEPIKDYAAGELFQRSAGSLINIFCANIVFVLLWKKQNLYTFPILIWAPTAFIQESIAIILDVMNGLPFDWAFVVAEGIPVFAVLCLSVIFLVVGCLFFLRLVALAGARPNYSLLKIMTICIAGIAPFFILSLVYVSYFLVSDLDNLVISKSISLGASIVLSIFLSTLFKPLYPVLERFLPLKTQKPERSHVGTTLFAASVFLIFGALFYN
jgi:hypothetical protein